MAFAIPQFADPLIILLISPVILGGWYAIRKGISRPLVISRVIILSLLIIALASPFTLGKTTVRDEAPRVTILSDQTMSMDLFNKDTGQKIFDAIKSKTPTTLREFAGIKSPIGDEVVQNAEGNNNIVLVSDGNSNYGKDLFDAISLVSQTGTSVFAVRQKPIHNDASVEIVSPKNLIIGNENVFNIVVRQAGNETDYRLDVSIDGASADSEVITQTERTKIIPVSYTFNSLGTHKVTATITPTGEDWFNLNNVFYKSVFVVPKPKVLAVTGDTGSPLYKVVTGLYNATTADSVPDDLTPYKAVIIDNMGAAQLSADTLRPYVGSGGGLVVVGGDASYDKGFYNNSPVESILPIISRAAEYRGGRNVVIIIDASGSTSAGVYGDPITNDKGEITGYTYENTVIGLEDANAISVVRYIDKGSSVGVVAFGGKTREQAPLSMGSEENRKTLEDFITQIGPKGGDNPTDIEEGLNVASDMLKGVSGSKLVIILSDGMIPKEDIILQAAQSLKNQDVETVVGQISTFYHITPQEKISEVQPNYAELAGVLGTQVTVYGPLERVCDQQNCLSGGPEATAAPTPSATPEVSFQYPLIAVDTSHFITKYLNLTASVTGYNEVTPKLGGDELVATTRGKPILTTWGFGLGRVAAFSTDNGDPAGNTAWASEVYSGDNSRLISAMINWAIGDPRPTEGVVIQADDIWGGTPGRVIITSDTLPQVNLDGTPLDLSRTGPTTYEAGINLEKEGFHDLSGYGIAVNYPLEYRDVGFNEQLETVIPANGGRVYSEDEVEGLLLLDIKEKAVRTVEQPQSEKEPFLLAALVLFLGEVIARRLKDYRKERPVIEEKPPRTEVPEASE